MKITNNQINYDTMHLLKTLIGKKLNKISHEPFIFSPTSYGIVYLSINNKNYIFKDYHEIIDYFLSKEEISSIKFESYNGPIKSSIENIDFISETINQKITKITIVNSEQNAIYNKTNEEYTFLDTQGIIFTLEDNYKIFLIKDNFCEVISIFRGYEFESQLNKIKQELNECFTSELSGKSKLLFIEL